jgi:signal transduction histidine kinase
MNFTSNIRKGFGYILVYLCIITLVAFFAYFNSSKYWNYNKNYTELPERDSLLMLSDTPFLNKNLPKASKTIKFIYKPIRSIEQTFSSSFAKKAKTYQIELEEVDIVPKLIEVRINRVKVSISDAYEVLEGSRFISLKFADLKFDGEIQKFQFSLAELGNYEDFGNPNTLNIHMPSGGHDIYVRVVSLKSQKVTKFAKISVSSTRPIEFRLWFWPLISILLAYPFYFFFYRSKINSQEFILKEKISLELQRNKITADLHDDIGASISSLQINSGVVRQILDTKPEEAKKMLEKIEALSESLADKIGDFIWSMKPGKDEFLTISSRIKNFVNEILGSTNIFYTIEIDQKIDKTIVDITVRKNIVLVIKEAINNVAKYSKATEVSINLQLENNTIILSIIDNGIGFDKEVKTGNGIENMKKRIEEINGNFTIKSVENKGTTIQAIIPLSLNYGTK